VSAPWKIRFFEFHEGCRIVREHLARQQLISPLGIDVSVLFVAHDSPIMPAGGRSWHAYLAKGLLALLMLGKLLQGKRCQLYLFCIGHVLLSTGQTLCTALREGIPKVAEAERAPSGCIDGSTARSSKECTAQH